MSPFKDTIYRLTSSRWFSIPAIVLLLAIFIGTGLWGIDLGHHWDEPVNIEHVSNSIKTNILLPTFYNYPSATYWTIFAALLPKLLTAIQSDSFSLLNYSRSTEFLLQARALFLVLSSLTIVWVYLLVKAWRKRTGEALLAAGLIALSWEVAYHSRWVALDGYS